MTKSSYSFENGNTYLSVLSNDHYDNNLFKVLKKLKGRKVCFVTLNKSAEVLENSLKSIGISSKDVLFIDAVSKSLGKNVNRENVLFLSSPMALTELSLAINEVSKTKKFDSIFFDSLSTLSIYDIKERTAQRFIASIIDKTKDENQMGVFTCLENDFKSPLIQKSCMYMDKVIPVAKYHRESYTKKKRMYATLMSLAVVSSFSSLLLFGEASGNSALSAAAITNVPAGSGFVLPSLLFALALVMLLLVYMSHRTMDLAVVSNKTLKKMKVSKENETTLKNRFRKKIKSWLSK